MQYDSDFYNSDFNRLWSGSDGGRDDLRRFKEQLNVNFVHLYDWNPGTQAGAPNGGKMRDYPLSVGQGFKLRSVTYHKTKRYEMKVVLNCARIKGKGCSWLLVTDLGLRPAR